MALQFLEAIQEITVKGFDPDEARDNHGRWTAGSDMSRSDRSNLRGALRDVAWGPKVVAAADAKTQSWYEQHGNTPKGYSWIDGRLTSDADAKQMREAQQKVDDLQRQLSDHAQDKSEDLYWGLHNQFQQAQSDLAELKAKIVGKAFDPDEPRDEHGRWSSSAGKEIHDAITRSNLDKLVGKVNDAHENFRGQLGEVRLIEKQILQLEKERDSAADEDEKGAIQDEIDGANRHLDDERGQLRSEARKLSGHVDKLAEASSGASTTLRSKLNVLKSLLKAFNPDEARDALGRWTSGDSGPDHPDFMDANDGYSMHEAFDGVTSKMEDSVAAISSAHDALHDAASNKDDVSSEEDDLLEEHGPESKEYTEWEGRNLKAGQDVADAAMNLRNAVADHLEATAGVLRELDTKIQGHANAEFYGSDRNVRAK